MLTAQYVERLSVRLSVTLIDSSSGAGGLAAEHPVGRKYRSTAAGAVLQAPGAQQQIRAASC